MPEIELPLDPFILSIAAGDEPGPTPDGKHTLVELPIETLSVEAVRRMAPDKVICWLFCPRYDVFDIAAHLEAAGFEGTLIAAAAQLPRKSIVEKELRARFPGLAFQLLSPARLSGRARAYHRAITRPSASPRQAWAQEDATP
ncbi:hypothetical protein [Marimonas lutisalis]|uniref:hypothetical protein n=1 Tax=Marimonas lutisalis TaxID=2545756 RepID=UPI0010F7400C|nr:hypothetical protein [Marimonas lutisalis]